MLCVFISCGTTDPTQDELNTIFRSVEKIDQIECRGNSIFFRSKDELGNARYVINDFYDSNKSGVIFAFVDKGCHLDSLNFDRYHESKWFEKKSELTSVVEAFCDIPISSFECDTCGNVYIGLTNERPPAYVMVRDEKCLSKNHTYELIQNDWFKVIGNSKKL